MIDWKRVAAGDDGLNIYKIEAESENTFQRASKSDPFGAILALHDTETTRYLLESFRSTEGPVGSAGFRVACHVISLPDSLWVIDSTFRTTGPEVFPGTLEEIVEVEGRSLAGRPIHVIYTHAHFDHAGGHAAVAALGSDVETFAHPHTQALMPFVSRREFFFSSKAGFFRDCGLSEDAIGELQGAFRNFLTQKGLDIDASVFAADESEQLRVDTLVDLEPHGLKRLSERVSVLRFDGHIPGHLCVLADGGHYITGDMWLPATTSTITPGTIAALARIPKEECGVRRYLDASKALLNLRLGHCTSYPSHESIFTNPKRMAMRDLELILERLYLVYQVLHEHGRKPMRILDLAWGGAEHLPIWKINESKIRLMMAYDEATAYVEDLVRVGDLVREGPDTYLATGTEALLHEAADTLADARGTYGHLEFRSRV